jgi:hypothetical protein
MQEANLAWFASVVLFAVAPMNVLLFSDTSRVALKVIVAGLDVAAVVLVGLLVARFARRFPHRRATLVPEPFPLRLGSTAHLRLHPPESVLTGAEIRAELRCVTEARTQVGRGRLAHQDQFSGVAHTQHATVVAASGGVQLAFELPSEAGPTELTDEPRVWELLVRAPTASGPDFEARYLVPVYREGGG